MAFRKKLKWHSDLQESRYAESHLGSRIWTWNPGSHADDIMAQGLNPEMSKMPRQGALGQRCVRVIVLVKF